MSDFFSKALDNVSGLEEEILGPSYPYYKYIKSPSQMGMGPSGGKIATNIKGLMAYGDMMSKGGGKASTTGGILGDKFFMKTGAKCKDMASGETVTRSIYINNVPDGSIPFITSMTGETTSYKGLVPGVLSDMVDLNPLGLFQAFMIGSNPDCRALTMATINDKNVHGTDTGYVITPDIQNMNACSFSDKINPITNIKCKEGFSQFDPDENNQNMIHIYYSSIGILGLYIMMKLVCKNNT